MVNVLMSTYNGEKYLSEQIESILNQSYKDIKLYIRDDGSIDSTIDIIRRYEQDPRVSVYEENNIGYGPSFMKLLSIAEDGDYWAFSDQDDVWKEDKLERAVDLLSGIENEIPLMYFHSYLLTDEKLNVIGQYKNAFDSYSFQKSITECVHLGFATVINKQLRDKMLQCGEMEIVSHDWWAEMVVMAFGRVYFDDYNGAKHRRLDRSVSSGKIINRVNWFINALKYESEIHKLTRVFSRVYGNDLDVANQEVLDLFTFEKYSLIKSIKKACYSHRWRSSLISEISLRFLMVIGKI